ncbi:SAM-dependent methyltransferase [Micromonospora peucetia]|uniref:O-Methyltransferase involved in polyketide biosynthesis n=1 Tax=Micromonospora peucetia TaxID=47871 RepID=A0A1C6W4S8_9ACTN|nr:SAM-dependent methyltransferase [Micromonospora peucetia]SCL73579.1 O-Methyltransferase involved in polyketide biosynthesis [Micromonospora peucetia]
MSSPPTSTSSHDQGRATVARIYDYLLGGKQNFEADREAARRLLQAIPDSANIARSNRLFMQRAVRTLAEDGIKQFLDLGSGIPTQGNVHEIAQAIDPNIRVLYVDIDPVAVVVSNQILRDNPTCRAIEGDFTRPDLILDALADGDLASVIDLDQPTAVLYCSVLQQVPDDRIDAVVTPIRERLAPGSAMVMSHISATVADRYDNTTVSEGKAVFRARAATEITLRTDAQLAALFGDLTLLEPGLVPLNEWRPELGEPDPYAAGPTPSPMRGAVAIDL